MTSRTAQPLSATLIRQGGMKCTASKCRPVFKLNLKETNNLMMSVSFKSLYDAPQAASQTPLQRLLLCRKCRITSQYTTAKEVEVKGTTLFFFLFTTGGTGVVLRFCLFILMGCACLQLIKAGDLNVF